MFIEGQKKKARIKRSLPYFSEKSHEKIHPSFISLYRKFKVRKKEE